MAGMNLGGFRRRVLARDGGCVLAYRGGCYGPLEAHHVLPKRRFPEWSMRMPNVTVLELASDERNGLTLCQHHHELIDSPNTPAFRLDRSDLPYHVFDFAQQYRLTWALDRAFPAEEGSTVSGDDRRSRRYSDPSGHPSARAR